MKKDNTVNINQTKYKVSQLKGCRYFTLTPFIFYANRKTDFDTIFDSDTTEPGGTHDWLAGGKGGDQIFKICTFVRY